MGTCVGCLERTMNKLTNCVGCTNGHPFNSRYEPDTSKLDIEGLRGLIAGDKRITAIKVVMKCTDLGVKAAKEFIDGLADQKKEDKKLLLDIELVRKSKEHWAELFRTIDELPMLAPDCPLCQKYNNDPDYDDTCTGCPIAEMSGESGCRNTPYDDVSEYRDMLRMSARDEQIYLEKLEDCLVARAEEKGLL